MARAPHLRQRPVVRLLSPLRDFLKTETSGAVLLAVGAVFALLWANSPWSGSYTSLWSSRASISVTGHVLDLDLRHWVNDALMTVFFLVVGLEIKRELTHGHLAKRRAALLPMTAALGGMIVPALIYLAIAGDSSPRGWAIPMATDIALALGVLAVAGDRIPSSLRAYLLGLAIVDDIGAIVIIAAFYSKDLHWIWLFAGLAGVLAVVAMRRAGIHSMGVYVTIGAFVWFSLHEAGIHPTLAGVAMGLLAPAVPRLHSELIDADELTDLSSASAAHASTGLAKGSVSVVEWLLHLLHPWTSYVIVPIFALANSGIEISRSGLRGAFGSPLTWGVFAGLVLGKPIGVFFSTKLAVRAGFADAPVGARDQQLLGIGAAAGIGFTVALFISELAFDDPVQQTNAKLAILVASALAAALSIITLRASTVKPGSSHRDPAADPATEPAELADQPRIESPARTV